MDKKREKQKNKQVKKDQKKYFVPSVGKTLTEDEIKNLVVKKK